MRGGNRECSGRKTGSVAKIDHAARKTAHAGGITPLEFLLAIMRDDTENRGARLDAAKAAAPYCHAKVSAASNVNISGTQRLEVSWLPPTKEE